MKKLLILLIILTIVIISLILIFPKKSINPTLNTNQNNMNTTPKIIRQSAVAGQFYPADKDELSNMIDDFLTQATTTSPTGAPQILIVPHAGYVFSGATAAYAYKTVADRSYDTVIILGGSHNYPFDGLALYDGDAVSTPLGEIEINKKLTAELIANNQNISANNKIHKPEHSLEVQIPFLQKTLTPGWQVILGLINSDDNQTLESVADSLIKLFSNQKILLIISSDLSHYPNYEDALYSDTKIIDSILTKDPDNFDQAFNTIISENRPNLDTCACGAPAIKIGMLVAKHLNLTGSKLHYANSGDTPDYGDPPANASREALRAGKSRVVGYGALIFSSESSPNLGGVPSANEAEGYRGNFLSPVEQTAALSLARNTLERAFNLITEKYENYKQHPIFSEKRGVFVTLRKGGELRGCIGLIEPIKELGEGIIEMAEAAAFDDPRFLSLEKSELKDITIEISVLTPPEKISDPQREIVLGRHGVIAKKGSHSGVFLPQVAEETGWDLDTFMSHLCADKAGLSANCWLDGSADIYTFEAQVFEEKFGKIIIQVYDKDIK